MKPVLVSSPKQFYDFNWCCIGYVSERLFGGFSVHRDFNSLESANLLRTAIYYLGQGMDICYYI